MKLRNVIFENGFIGAVNELILQPLPALEAYKLVKLVKELTEKETVYKDAKIAVFKKHGAKESKDGVLTIPNKEAQKKAAKELDEVVLLEEEYSFTKKIVLPKDILLSARQLLLLEEIVEVEG